jgi:hypothetical protein
MLPAQRSVAKYMELETTIVAGKQLSARAGSSSASHAIPVIGAVVSGVVDGATTASVGRFAKKVFRGMRAHHACAHHARAHHARAHHARAHHSRARTQVFQPVQPSEQPTPAAPVGEAAAEADASADPSKSPRLWTRLSGLSSWWSKRPSADADGTADAEPAGPEHSGTPEPPVQPARAAGERAASAEAASDVHSGATVCAQSASAAPSSLPMGEPHPTSATARLCGACGELCVRGKFCPQCGSPLGAVTGSSRTVPPPPPPPPPPPAGG